MNLELVNTYDGSNSLKNLIINDSYHSKYGAINESKHIFINNGLKRISKKKIRVLEIGFGTGLNALLTQLYCDKKEQNIIYHTIDNLPLKKDTYSSLNYCDQLKIDKDIFLKIHNSLWENEIELSNFFVLKKINCDFTKKLFNEKYDLIYFDAFSPSKQPEMWVLDNFKKLYNCLNRNGVLITYSSKGDVKRAIKEVGFNVFSIAGPTGKREITLACKN
tara:strand:- start:482 stop:1138 length:657 start_codon:yes stop_codon:yes gene_type:complete